MLTGDYDELFNWMSVSKLILTINHVNSLGAVWFSQKYLIYICKLELFFCDIKTFLKKL